MLGDYRLCSYVVGNDFVDGKRGHNHGSKSPKDVTRRNKTQQKRICFGRTQSGKADVRVGGILDLAEKTGGVSYQMASIFLINYETRPSPDNRNRLGVRNVCGEESI